MEQPRIRERFSVMNNAYRAYSFSYFLDSMQRLGLDQIDLWGGYQHFDPFSAGPSYLRAFREELSARQMKLICYTPEILGYPFNFASAYAEIRARSLAYCCKNIELASELEVPLMLVNPGWGVWDERYDEAFDRAAASLQSAADYAAQQGFRLVLEHLTPQSSNLLTSADKVSRMVQSIGRKNLGVALDLGQMSVFGESVSDYFGPLGDKIWMVHIMDGAPGRHLAFGDGILPLQAYCRQLRRAGYQGPITLEINDAQYAKAPEAALQQCLRAMAQWEEEAP